jgi:type VI secretion system secreted protein VgrG
MSGCCGIISSGSKNAITVDGSNSINLKVGEASISMKKDGTIRIKGKDITVEGWDKVTVKAGTDVVLKGSRVLQN